MPCTIGLSRLFIKLKIDVSLLVQKIPEAHSVVTGNRRHNGLPDAGINAQDL